MNESVFKKYYGKLRRNAILKSFLWGLAFGFIAAFIAGFAMWMSYEKGFLITIGVFVGVTALVTALCYFLFFRPTAKDVARKVDSLGLEERMITMLELENSEDYIAMRQREDAKASLGKLGDKKFSIGASVALIITLSISAVFGVSAATVTGLSDLGVIKSGAEMIDEARGRDPRNYVTVNYEALSGGYIYGEKEQTIKKNGETETVLAVAEDGYRFYCWTDGYPYPVRADKGVGESTTFTARFVKVDDDGAEEKPDGDESDDQPPEDGNDTDEENPPSPSSNPENYDYVIDWTINYRDVLGDYYEEAMRQLAESGELSDELRKFIESYFNSLK